MGEGAPATGSGTPGEQGEGKPWGRGLRGQAGARGLGEARQRAPHRLQAPAASSPLSQGPASCPPDSCPSKLSKHTADHVPDAQLKLCSPNISFPSLFCLPPQLLRPPYTTGELLCIPQNPGPRHTFLLHLSGLEGKEVRGLVEPIPVLGQERVPRPGHLDGRPVIPPLPVPEQQRAGGCGQG